ncbi:polysaccharide pyruvyl transferase family protein [Sphingobium fuliginis]|uniref:Succinoglycan biosynthesis protein exoV n=1 Tax=Sphingobium fuliginis (strain ATCC 27551) TaxID=336203 RepID=A0A292ZLE8_SPHSA|nr:polysaccharide pyruvyl transferase family protein [Sphingobium fuliginis]GAY23645.1 succinoglycan biosynthesis protein exoV [Sphingobium fuliginis]
MKLYYYRAPQGNFGDDLNGWLWEELAPGRWSDEDDGELFCGIGTIIGNDMPQAKRIRVFSSGIGYRPVPADFDSGRWKVTALRGPLTAQVVGRPERAVADGALLLSTLPRLKPLAEEERHGTIFIPHYEAMDEGPWERACGLAGVELVDPRQCAHRVIERIRSARLVIADSMHAAIIADTMRVPWVPVASSRRINSFKWLDWTLSLDLPYEPVALPSISLRAYYEGQVQRCIGQDFRLPRPDRDSAMAHYRRMMRREGNALWQSVRPKVKHHLRALPGRLPAQRAARGAMTRWDRRRTERMATVLHRLVGAPAFLSGDAIFAQRVEQLSRALDGIAGGREG